MWQVRSLRLPLRAKRLNRVSAGRKCPSAARRLRIESLESRSMPSVNLVGPELLAGAPPSDSSSPTAVPAAAGDAQAFLIGVAWYGKGQVQMRTSSGHGFFFLDSLTDPGSRPTDTGPNKYSWFFNDVLGDPVAYVANSKPILKGLFSLTLPPPKSAEVKTLQVRAEGGGLSFESQVVRVPKGASQVKVTLTTKNTVGDNIDDRDANLQWSENVNGQGWMPEPGVGHTSQVLFVTYGQPKEPGVNRPTARRIEYATDLAKGIVHSNLMAVAGAIDADAMSQSHFINRTQGDIYAKEAGWKVLTDGGGMCADESWLMHDSLDVLGIWSQVRFVYPRAEGGYLPNGKKNNGWAGLLGYGPQLNEWRTTDFRKSKTASDYLGYLDGAAGAWENYEGCCFVHSGADKRYYMGGYAGLAGASTFETTAFGVWNYVTNDGALQRWNDDRNTPIAPPTAPPPTY
jgi:hypothetical protein